MDAETTTSFQLLDTKIKELAARVAVLETAPKPVVADAATAKVADDEDLDGPYGDPVVKWDPPQWKKTGKEGFAGKPYSQCSVAYLEGLASFLEWSAKKREVDPDESKRKYASWNRLDAARALGWAKRKRNGWVPPPSAVEDTDVVSVMDSVPEETITPGGDKIPF